MFRWWTNRHGARPLTAWVHITGPVAATNGWNWIIQARLDTPRARAKAPDHDGATANGEVRITLQHPPVWELQEFARLTAQLQALNDQAQALSNQVSAAAARIRQIHSSRLRSRLLALEARELTASENQAKALLAAVRRQIADCRARLAAYPSGAKYTVDCLALDTGGELDGLPIYDYGVPAHRSSDSSAAAPKPAADAAHR